MALYEKLEKMISTTSDVKQLNVIFRPENLKNQIQNHEKSLCDFAFRAFYP